MRTAEEFWARTEKQPNGCIFWIRSRDSNGYGTLYWRDRYDRAHRVSFLLSGRKLTKGMYVCHSCDTPQCVNPKHLFIGTPLVNTRDAQRKGRLKRSSRYVVSLKERVKKDWKGNDERKYLLALRVKRDARLRKQVLGRDKGICFQCGLDCEDLKIRMDALRRKAQTDIGREAYLAAWVVMEQFGFRRHATYWEADHDNALAEGGWDNICNLVTRCRPCHKEKSSEQSSRKARRRRLIGRKRIPHDGMH